MSRFFTGFLQRGWEVTTLLLGNPRRKHVLRSLRSCLLLCLSGVGVHGTACSSSKNLVFHPWALNKPKKTPQRRGSNRENLVQFVSSPRRGHTISSLGTSIVLRCWVFGCLCYSSFFVSLWSRHVCDMGEKHCKN